MRPADRTATAVDMDYTTEATRSPELVAMLTLWGAVFRQGVDDAVIEMRRRSFHRVADSTPYSGALRWLHDTYVRPGSFCWLCELFNLEPASALSRILARRRLLLANAVAAAPIAERQPKTTKRRGRKPGTKNRTLTQIREAQA